jgi:transposase
MRFVPIKTVAQQAAGMVLKTRDLLVRQRLQASNALRGHMAELGVIAAKGRTSLGKLLAIIRDRQNSSIPDIARTALQQLVAQIQDLTARVERLDRDVAAAVKVDTDARRLTSIPGVGPIIAAWLGLTPKDHATAGKVRLGVITRAGDAALRSVLVARATAVIRQVGCGRGAVSPWRVNRLKRKPPKLAAVALANKIARLAWSLMVTGESYAAKSASATRASAAWRSARHGERLTCNRAGLVPDLAR